MSDTTYVDYTTPAVNATWLNEINDHVWHDTPVSGTTVHNASVITNTPAGGISATNIQVAINELDTKKVAFTRLDDSDGSSLVGFIQQGTGAVTTTVQSKLRESVSVKDFGAVGDGVANDATAFDFAAQAADGRPVLVPAGTYKLDYSPFVPGVEYHLHNVILTGPGSLTGATLVWYTIDGSTHYTTQSGGAKWKFGQNKSGATGLQIGGGVLQQGGEGMMLYADGYSGWTAAAPSQYPSSAEFAIQPSSIAGECQVISGTNRVVRSYGGEFVPSLVGMRIYVGVGQTYTIDSFVSANEVTVCNLNRSAVSFGSTLTMTFVVVPCKGTGLCNVNGTVVTRVSGDPFLILGNGDDRIRINGVEYGYASLPSQDVMNITSSAGVQTNVPYEFWTTVDNLSSALRVHRVSAAGFEENVTLGAYADGYFHLQAAGGIGRQYPFYIGSGYDARGKRQQITMDGQSGNTLIGGGYDWPSAEFEYKNTATNWWYFLAGLPGGGAPTVVARGPDPNIPLSIQPKGSADVNINGVLLRAGPANSVGEFTKLHVPYEGGGSQYGISIRPRVDVATAMGFYNAAGSVIGSITTSAASTSFNTSSDYRLKHSVQPMLRALDRVQSMRPCTYVWKADESAGEGFLAHELQEIVPLAVTGERDGERMQSVDYSKVVPVLTAAVQELAAKVAELELHLKL